MCVIFIGTIYIYKYGLFLNGVQRTKYTIFLKEIIVLLHWACIDSIQNYTIKPSFRTPSEVFFLLKKEKETM